jgi:hypothetical protein
MAGPASAPALAVMLGAIVEMLPPLPWYEVLWPALDCALGAMDVRPMRRRH